MDEAQFFLAVAAGQTAEVREALAKHPEYARVSVNRRPAICRAAFGGHLEVVRLLLDHGADINASDGDGDSALANALLREHTDVAELLMQRGAVPDATALRCLRLRETEQREAEARSMAPVTPAKQSQGGCFIATACYGSYDHPDVLVFRRFRDERLLPSRVGRVAVALYYTVSPVVAAWVARVPWASRTVRQTILEPLAWRLRQRG